MRVRSRPGERRRGKRQDGPKGTSIYGGEKAVGTYYNGSNLSGINKKYASDKNWANAVFSYMQYLYNKL